MIRTEIVGSNAVVDGYRQLPEDVRNAANAGVAEATNKLRDDVALHTPAKSGRARSAVVAWFRAGSGTVQYDYRITEAFYMRFVVAGALPHRIVPQYSTRRGLRQAVRRREKLGLSTDIKAKRALRLTWTFASAGSAGIFAARVNHPGIGARRILTRRLEANEADILAGIRVWVEKAIYLRALQAQSQANRT